MADMMKKLLVDKEDLHYINLTFSSNGCILLVT